MATPPPIIRSSKAFSVEIPEGSNSAKSRRSDIVASDDDLEIHRKSSQFHEAGADSLKSPDFHTDDGSDARSVSVASTDHADNLHHEAQAETDKDRYAGENSHALSENLQGFDQSQSPVNLIAVDENAQNDDNRQVLQDEAYRDRQAHGESGHALQDRFGTETNAPLKDRVLSIQSQGLRSNVQGIEQDALKDNRQGVADEALKHANQGLARSQDPANNMQGIAQDALHNNQQSINNEALHDNQQALADEGLHDNQQSIDNEALHDNNQALADEGLHDNQQSINNEALHDNNQALADEGLHDNQQSIDNEALHGRKDTQAKAHVQDHVVALPDTHQVLKPGPSPLAVNPHTGQRPGVADHAPTAPQLEADPQHAALSKAEKAKRMEEFHGRVEAIRKSVSGINHLLDDLQDKP